MQKTHITITISKNVIRAVEEAIKIIQRDIRNPVRPNKSSFIETAVIRELEQIEDDYKASLIKNGGDPFCKAKKK